MVLILRDSIHQKDKTFQWIGLSIFLSYLFYIPVILFVREIPMLGMLMIPKTLAYIVIAIIAYNAFYRERTGNQ